MGSQHCFGGLSQAIVQLCLLIVNSSTNISPSQVILNSMHKFQPRIYLVRRREAATGPVTDIEKEEYRTFVFPETQFTAVTAYQNQLVSDALTGNKYFSVSKQIFCADHQTQD